MVSVQFEGGLAVVAGGVKVARACGVPTHRVERKGFPHWLTEAAEEVEGVHGVIQRPAVVPSQLPSGGERPVGVCSSDKVVVTHG